MIAMLFILGFTGLGLSIAMGAAAAAPVGYEDETGFHYGPEHVTAQEEVAWEASHPQHA